MTTVHKAKEVRPWIDRLVLKAQDENEREAYRFVMSQLFTKSAVHRLIKEIAPRLKEDGYVSGFTRVKTLGRRHPDAAQMAMIEIVGNPIDLYEKRQQE